MSTIRLGKIIKSNSHCDYVVQVDDSLSSAAPPQSEDYGFGNFVKLETDDRHWAVGIIYNSQIFNPNALNTGPRLSSEPDPVFTPDLINEVRILLWTVLVGTLEGDFDRRYGVQGIPSVVVPVETPVWRMSDTEIYQFHLNAQQRSQFHYYNHLLRCGGTFATQLTQQVLEQLIQAEFFSGAEQRALQMLCRELTWKNTVIAMR